MTTSMDDPMELLREQLEHLRVDSSRDDRLKTLQQLRLAIHALHPNQLAQIATKIQLAALYDSLNCQDKAEIELACDILSTILNAIPSSAILERYQTELRRCLHHPDTSVKTLALSQLTRAAADPSTHPLFIPDNSQEAILPTVASLIANDDLGLATTAGRLIERLGSSDVGLDAVFSPDVLQQFRSTMDVNETVRFRTYEVMVGIACLSPSGFNRCHKENFLSPLVDEVLGEDILLQLNSLQLLGRLAQSSHGMQFLESSGVAKKLEKLMDDLDGNTFASFLLPGLIKFFGHMGQQHPAEVCRRHKSFLQRVVDIICDARTDKSLQGIAVDTIGAIGASADGKRALEESGEMKRCLKAQGEMFYSGVTDLKVKSLNSVESLMTIREEEVSTELLSLTESWFMLLPSEAPRSGPSTMNRIVSICRQPFPDLHAAALQLLIALAPKPWAQRRIVTEVPGFVEYILDRGTETEKLGKELKYELVKRLAQTSTAADIFGNEAYLRLREFVSQGPFYVATITSVAFEGAS